MNALIEVRYVGTVLLENLLRGKSSTTHEKCYIKLANQI